MQRFSKSNSGASSSRRYAEQSLDGDEYGNALPLGRGIERCPMPSFDMPATVDVRPLSSSPHCPAERARRLTPLPPPRNRRPAAASVPPAPHGRRVRPVVPDQDQPRHDDARLQVPGRHRRCGRLARDGRQLHRCVPLPLLLARLVDVEHELTKDFLLPRSVGHGQECDRDQPVLARHDGRWRRCVPFSPSPSSPSPARADALPLPLSATASHSRLPVLGDVPRDPVPPARAAQPRAHLGRRREQVPEQPRLLVQGDGPLDGDDDLRLGQDGAFPLSLSVCRARRKEESKAS